MPDKTSAIHIDYMS